MKLLEANPQPRVAGLEPQPGEVNYLIGNDPTRWRTNIPTYAKVKYEAVYPGVDLVYYGDQRQLEYDFVVAPRADPSTIALGFEGADKLEVDAQGDLVIHTAASEIRQPKPKFYQEVNGEQREVGGAFQIKRQKAKGNRQESEIQNPKSKIQNPEWVVGFDVGAYDAASPLIIDPVLIYSTFLGNSTGDRAFGIALDPAGNAYVTGFTKGINFPTTANVLKPNLDTPFDDAFVAKLSPAGTLLYSTYLGGQFFEVAHSIIADAAGNAYVTGFTNSPDFPTTANAIRRTNQGDTGNFDAFVAKLNAGGSALIYSTYLGSRRNDRSLGLAVDAAGNAYVTGDTDSADFPTANALQPALGSPSDAFVAKVNPAGSALVYSTYLGGSLDDMGFGIAVDANGTASVTGGTDR